MDQLDTLSRSYTDSFIADNSSMVSRHSTHESFIEARRKSHHSSICYDSIEAEAQQGDNQITPLPKLQMFIIAIILFSEPLTSTILFPFIYFMLKDFHVSEDEKEIGKFAGWITSIFFIAQFCTAIMWGKISDRYGRRPVLLCGLIGNALSTCLFGLSKSLAWAVGARALCGIMNGNAGVARSMVSEITDHTNKAKAFSLFGFCWGAGMIGGYLNHPATHFPSLFSANQFLKDYPYFLPCFVSALGSTIGFILGYIYLKESNPIVLQKRANGEYASLLKANHTTEQHESPGISQISKTSLLVVVVYSLFSFYAMIFDEVLPLYFTAPKYAGGLGLTSTEFAEMLSLMGITQLGFQFLLYPALTKRFSILGLFQFSLFLFLPICFIFPSLSSYKEWIAQHIQNQSTGALMFKCGYLFILLFRYLGNCLAFTSLGIMVSISATPEILGTVNGESNW
ncbi:hypothetical protein RO3G_15471 [Rhizopus delemar RA 99-880]|uniref:Major facilitator superfamily (MFS) profile domain-containing protein n=1 Tax=Rhizopus delemar (strain RA 99-880 / ATCC MYA-4621 / FGSC 9543 / NRRL 43880) TaxID=246409 RepID=I1CQN0_RHIO9|nr:hypothetical protein RO3G_15471 [Rhizopus delemar RA 99-880]|eukprot:EIE90760.1 hypothetical protein RO3G_15471 [Rhizopus delemar RA 99-880]